MFTEGDFLKPLDSAVREDTDAWPEFVLKNVKVVSQKTGEPANLLAAHGKFLVRVEGVLEEIDNETAHLIKDRNYSNKTISITNVATYSFSLFDDGSFGFWAAGKAGWFEIRKPAKVWQDIYADMEEAVGMFYYLADKYRLSGVTMSRASAKTGDAHIKHLFTDYLNSTYSKREGLGDAREGFYHHREFLMKSMLEGQEGLNWHASPVLRHFRTDFPQDFAVAREIVGAARAFSTWEAVKSMQGSSMTSGATNLVDGPNRKLSTSKPMEKADAGMSTQGSRDQAGRKTEIIDLVDDDEDEEEVTSLTTSIPTGHKRKGALRPRSNQASKKFITRKESLRSATRTQQDQQGDVDDSENSTSEPAASSSTSRNQSTSRASRSQTDASRKNAMAETQALVEPQTADQPLPSYYEPHGPGNIWTCPYDGCNQKVWEARARTSVSMIKEHFIKTHAGQAEALVNQETRPWVSVNHLLERIKGIASLPSPETAELEGFPPRIVRRY